MTETKKVRGSRQFPYNVLTFIFTFRFICQIENSLPPLAFRISSGRKIRNSVPFNVARMSAICKLLLANNVILQKLQPFFCFEERTNYSAGDIQSVINISS